MLAIIGLLVVAGSAPAATRALYSGRTSQHQRISFSISAHQLTGLSFRIETRCPHHKLRAYKLGHFSKFAITGSSFDQKFVSPQATAVLKGRLKGNRITGSVSFVAPAAACSGHATYVVTQRHLGPPPGAS